MDIRQVDHIDDPGFSFGHLPEGVMGIGDHDPHPWRAPEPAVRVRIRLRKQLGHPILGMHGRDRKAAFEQIVHFFSDQFFPAAFHPTCFHHREAGHPERELFSKIKQGESNPDQQGFLILGFEPDQGIEKLFMIIQVKT
jgi:hypothetical protein